MPIADPYAAAKPKPKKAPAPAAPTGPSYPMADQLTPDKLQGLLDQGYVDYGDGELIPPMGGNTSSAPGANAAGGPAGPQADIRSDIFKDLYRSGRQSGNPSLMTMARPPMPLDDPMAFLQAPPPDLPGFPQTDQNLRQMPQLPPSPQAPDYTQASTQQKPGMQAMQRRFPRATSLLSGANGAPPLRRRGR